MNKRKAPQLFHQAVTLHQNGKLDAAASLYTQLLAADPKHADVLRMFGMLQLQCGNWQEGARLSKASLKCDPMQPEVLNNQGYALQNLGRDEEALACYDKAVKLKPGFAVAWYNRGNVLQNLKRYGDAVSSYRQALATRPEHADTHVNLGNTLKLMECYAEAVSSYEGAVALNPTHAIAYNNLGNTLKELGRNDEALLSFGKAIALDPRYADAYFNAAIVLQDLGRYDEALSGYQKTLALKPDHAEACLNSGATLKELKRYDEALASYDQALTLKPDYVDACVAKGRLFVELKKHDEALVSYDRALSLKPNYPDAYVAKGNLFVELKNYDEALANYDRALSLKPDYAGAYAAKGSLLMEFGKMEEAERCMSKAVELAPGEATSLIGLLSLLPYQPDDSRFAQLEAVYDRRGSLPLPKKIGLNFAMGKAMEKISEYDRAFAAYQEGNQLRYLAHPFNEAEDETTLRKTCAFFTRELFEQASSLERALSPVQDERVPIFIVGMPRSGTTLIEQILASHPSLFGAGELTTFGELANQAELPQLDSPNWEAALLDMRRIGREYLDQVWKLAPDARYITDKMPHNFLNLGLIHLMLPNAKIIHSMRDPMDSGFSCYALNFKEGHEYCYDMGMLGRHILRYQKFMSHWHSVLPPGRILDISYEDNVADPEREARRLLEYVGLPWDPACLKFYETKRAVSTASVAQVRKPMYSSSVARWKRFEKHLGPLIEIVGSST